MMKMTSKDQRTGGPIQEFVSIVLYCIRQQRNAFHMSNYSVLHREYTTLICQQTTPGHSTLVPKHHRPTGFICGWSVDVEFFARLLAWSCCWPRYIQTTFENFRVCFVL